MAEVAARRVWSGGEHAAPGRTFDSYSDFYQDSFYGKFPQEHRSGGHLGVEMLRARQQDVDLVDPPMPVYAFQIGLMAEGVANTDIGDGMRWTRRPTPHDVFVAPPDTEVRYRIAQPHTAWVLSVPAASLHSLVEEYDLTQAGLGHHVGRFHANPRAAGAFGQLWRLCRPEGQPTPDLLVDGVLMQFLAAVYGLAEMSPSADAAREDRRVAAAVDYVEAHLGERLSVERLAAVACLSPGHLSRMFKATTGEPVWAYVQRRRCERARDRLPSSPEPISQIAHECGFASQAHLTHAFTKHFGHPPGALRR